MVLSFACAAAHTPGITAWTDAAPEGQRAALFHGFDQLREDLSQSRSDALIILTSEHWSNFFLDHVSAFCIGRAEQFSGPVEPWLKVPATRFSGDPNLAKELLLGLFEHDFEPSFSYAMAFDHGTMVPLHLIMPEIPIPVVPVMFNTLATPQPTARRCLALGRVLGQIARRSSRRIGIIATGGLSHDPGELHHGTIDAEFDRAFLEQMARADLNALADYTAADLMAAGAGAMELLAWIALAGALDGTKGRVLAYEAVKPWATGCGLMVFGGAGPAADPSTGQDDLAVQASS